jgi:glycosyltransferase involved in cell wall biosynthesis
MGYRNAATIAETVASVEAQRPSDDADSLQIVVVTSGPDSGCDGVRRRWPTLTIIEVAERLMPGAARNLGVAVATGEVVAFIAADCWAEDGWVSERRRIHGDGHRAVASSIVPIGRRPAALASWLLLSSKRLPGYTSEVVQSDSPRRHSLSYDRKRLVALGPFDESMRIGEDTDMANRWHASGEQVWFAPSVRLANRGPMTIRELVADQHRRGILVGAHARRQGNSVRWWSNRRRFKNRSIECWVDGVRYSQMSVLRVTALMPVVCAGLIAQLRGASAGIASGGTD